MVKSKHGDLRRGDVREDGKVFWSYSGKLENWTLPDTFISMLAKAKEHSAKLSRSGAVERTDKWRKENKEKFAVTYANQVDAYKSKLTMARVHKGMLGLLEALEDGTGRSNKRFGISDAMRPEVAKYLKHMCVA